MGFRDDLLPIQSKRSGDKKLRRLNISLLQKRNEAPAKILRGVVTNVEPDIFVECEVTFIFRRARPSESKRKTSKNFEFLIEALASAA